MKCNCIVFVFDCEKSTSKRLTCKSYYNDKKERLYYFSQYFFKDLTACLFPFSDEVNKSMQPP